MYTSVERDQLRKDLLARARTDPRISGAGITGSAAAGREDPWSDIDLAFGVSDASEIPNVLVDWTAEMYRRGAVHHFDVTRAAWIYRVFLLRSTLQVDLAFAPATQFGARAPTFRLVFGAAVDRPHVAPPAAEELIGLAWVYALHARSALARGKPLQCEYMISAVRDHTLSLACLRYDLPAVEARGIDRLPADVTGALEGALVRSLEPQELARAFRVAIDVLLAEMRFADTALAARLEAPLVELAAPR